MYAPSGGLLFALWKARDANLKSYQEKKRKIQRHLNEKRLLALKTMHATGRRQADWLGDE
jgi:hypothetical protein